MPWNIPLALCALACLIPRYSGYPSQIRSCEAWVVGGYAPMMAGSLKTGNGGVCKIDAFKMPSRGYVPGEKYMISVRSTNKALFKLYSSDGQCLGNAYSSAFFAHRETFEWVAPREKNVTLHALCGTDYITVYAAEPLEVSRSASVTTTLASTSTTTTVRTSTTTRTSTAAKVAPGAADSAAPRGEQTAGETPGTDPGVRSPARFQLSEELAMEYVWQNSDEVTISVELLDRHAWISLGVAAGRVLSMDGEGEGSDVVICSDAVVRRYLVMDHDTPKDGHDLPGARCSYANGRTKLTFTRAAAAKSARHRAVTPGTPQEVIFAWGKPNEITMDYHGKNRGGVLLDFGSAKTLRTKGADVPYLLWVHLVCMSIAAGAMLPFGVVVVRHTRKKKDAAPGAWLKNHRRIQVAGLLILIVGAAAGIAHVELRSRHGASYHAVMGFIVVAVMMLQPISAALRPPPTPRTWKRKAFEKWHNYAGRSAILLGFGNLITGTLLLSERGFSYEGMSKAAAIALASLMILLFFEVYVWLFRDSVVLRWLSGSPRDPKVANASQAATSSDEQGSVGEHSARSTSAEETASEHSSQL